MYYGTAWNVAFLISLALIPLGVVLCRYTLKWVILSLIGTAVGVLYFSMSIQEPVRIMTAADMPVSLVLLQYGLPPLLLVVASAFTLRFSLAINSRHRIAEEVPSRVTKQIGLQRIPRWEMVVVGLIAATVLTVHLVYISKPSIELGDEYYYTRAANGFLDGKLFNAEHPPLGKWLIAAGIAFLGDNAAGWRVASIIFAVALVFVFYFLCRSVMSGTPTFIPLLATFLFSFENMTFVMGHVAMLDVFYVTFMLLGFLFYLRGNYWLAGIFLGLSMLAKAMALLGIVAVLLHWTISQRRDLRHEITYMRTALSVPATSAPKASPILVMAQLLIPVVVLWAAMPLLEYPVNHQLVNPLERTMYMLAMHLTANPITGKIVSTISQPWDWIVQPISPNIDINAIDTGPHYFYSLSWTLWALIIPVVGFLVYEFIRLKGKTGTGFILSWFAGVYLLLIPLELLTWRSMYNYYLYPAVGAICLGIAWAAWHLWERFKNDSRGRFAFQVGLSLYLVASLTTFAIMGPWGSGLGIIAISW